MSPWVLRLTSDGRMPQDRFNAVGESDQGRAFS